MKTESLPREKWDTWDPTLISEVIQTKQHFYRVCFDFAGAVFIFEEKKNFSRFWFLFVIHFYRVGFYSLKSMFTRYILILKTRSVFCLQGLFYV